MDRQTTLAAEAFRQLSPAAQEAILELMRDIVAKNKGADTPSHPSAKGSWTATGSPV